MKQRSSDRATTTPASVGPWVCSMLFALLGLSHPTRAQTPLGVWDSMSTPTITVTSPNGGESWTAGTTYAVTWTSTNTTGRVNIVLEKAGEFYMFVGNVLMSAGSYNWSIPSYVSDGDDYRVWISWYDLGSSTDDVSDAPFQITRTSVPPTITVTSPNGGEVWAAGSTQPITWESTNPTGNVSILLKKAGTAHSAIAFVAMADGSFDWSIPALIGDGTDYTVAISWSGGGSPVEDVSDHPFEITGSMPLPTIRVTRPNGGEVWQAGTVQPVTWESTNPIGTVSINLMKAGTYHLLIGSSAMSQGTFDWAIPAYVGDATDYTVAISWSDAAGSVDDVSDAPFEITGSLPLPSVIVTSPNGGELWPAGGMMRTITWTSVNPTGDVEIVLKKGGLYQASIGSAPMSARTFDWTIPSQIVGGSDYRVEVSWYGDGASVTDASDGPFSIAPDPPLSQDLDQDGDVDDLDAALFIPCLTGDGVTSLPGGCSVADFDADLDVDLSDFGILQRCYSGENVLADPNCAN